MITNKYIFKVHLRHKERIQSHLIRKLSATDAAILTEQIPRRWRQSEISWMNIAVSEMLGA